MRHLILNTCLLLLVTACQKAPNKRAEAQSQRPVTMSFESPQLLVSKPGSEWLVDYVKTGKVFITEVVLDTRITDHGETVWRRSFESNFYGDEYRVRSFTANQLKEAKTVSELSTRLGDPDAELWPLDEAAHGVELWRIWNGVSDDGAKVYNIFAGRNRMGELQCVLISAGGMKLTTKPK